MLVSWKIPGLKNSLWLMTQESRTKVIYDYPHSFVELSKVRFDTEYILYKVSYSEDNDNYHVEEINIHNYNEKQLSLHEYTAERDPIYHTLQPIEIHCETFDRIKALVKPLFDLLYEDYFIGLIDDAYLVVGHCFYYEDELGWYLCRVRYICDTYFDCDCIEVDPENDIKAGSKFLSAYYDFFQENQPKYIDPEFFDSVWNMYKEAIEKSLNILCWGEE